MRSGRQQVGADQEPGCCDGLQQACCESSEERTGSLSSTAPALPLLTLLLAAVCIRSGWIPRDWGILLAHSVNRRHLGRQSKDAWQQIRAGLMLQNGAVQNAGEVAQHSGSRVKKTEGRPCDSCSPGFPPVSFRQQHSFGPTEHGFGHPVQRSGINLQVLPITCSQGSFYCCQVCAADIPEQL